MKIENNLFQSGFFKTKPNYNDEVIDRQIVEEIVNFLKNKILSFKKVNYNFRAIWLKIGYC